MLVPYVAMKLPDDRKAGLETLIASVALGPTAPTYPLRKALQLMGYSFLQVGRSGVPLR
jgi:hypothetical protein